jgi:ABC-type transport system, involved in lipoprotein release, permease component
MSAERFIARRLNEGAAADDRMGRISNNIAWICVAVSVAIMIIAIVVVAGFKSEIRDKSTGFMGSVVLIQPGEGPLNERYPFPDTLSYRKKLSEIRGVEQISGVCYRSGLIKTEENIHGLYFKGVDSLYNLSFFEKCLSEGSLPDFSGKMSSDVLISRRVASMMGYKVGDKMLAYFIGDDVKVRNFIVCGIFDAQLDEVDKSFVLVDRRQVQRLNGWDAAQVSSLELRLDDKASIDLAARAADEVIFTREADNDPSLFVTSVKKIYPNLFDWLALLDLNVLMILALMMLVAGFNMISAILIILFKKISMIGLLKSMGMTDKGVSGVFRRVGASIVGKGLLLGNVLAIAIALVQKWTKVMKLDPANYFVSYVPIKFNVWQIVLVDVISALVIMLILSLSTAFISKVSPDRTVKVS